MKTWPIVVVCLLLGLGMGLGGTMIELGARPGGGFGIDHAERHADPQQPPVAPLAGAHPTVAVDADEFDAGLMQRESEHRHAFVFRNTGNAPLLLKKGSTTCKCTVSKVLDDSIPPGGSADVVLEWKTFSSDGPFGQRAEILTNDPSRPRVTLVIKGRVQGAFSVVPDVLAMGSLSANATQQATARVYGFLDAGIQIERYELSDPRTAASMAVEVSPIPAGMLAQPDARNGYTVVLTVKPGLPLGPIRQKILLHTNLAAAPLIEIPVDGEVIGDVAIYGIGCDFDPKRNLLNLGTVASRQGASAKLLVRIKGPDHRRAKLSLATSDPAWLKADVGTAKESADGRSASVELTVRVPSGSPSEARLGSKQGRWGELVFDTGLDEARQIKVYVRLAVEE